MSNYDRKFALRMFFDEIIKLSHTRDMMVEVMAAGGYSLGGLISNLIGPKSLIDKIANDYTGESHEFRLNKAGLKLYWRLDREFDLLKIRIGGDQAKDYPRFVDNIRNILKWNSLR